MSRIRKLLHQERLFRGNVKETDNMKNVMSRPFVLFTNPRKRTKSLSVFYNPKNHFKAGKNRSHFWLINEFTKTLTGTQTFLTGNNNDNSVIFPRQYL